MRPTSRLLEASGRPGRSRVGGRPGVEVLEGRALMSFSALDPSFGQGGAIVGPITLTGTQSPPSVAVQPDGKVVVVGLAEGAVTKPTASVVVRRLNFDGSPDASFGTAGAVVLPVPSGASAGLTSGDVVLQPDGKIVLAEVAAMEGFVTTIYQTIVVRLNADGSPDASFGQGGSADFAPRNAALGSLALQADGKIVAAGRALPDVSVGGSIFPSAAVARLNPDGTPDQSFDAGGILTFDRTVSSGLGDVTDAAVGPDGKIVLAGTVTTSAVPPMTLAEVIRLNPDGSPDATFNASGFEQLSPPQAVAAVAVQPDGKILVAGNSIGQLGPAPALVRLNVDGPFDAGFHAAFATPTGPLDSRFAMTVAAVAIQPDGKILVGGTQPSTGRTSFAVSRFNPDGSKDVRFGIDGEATFRVASAPLTIGAVVGDLAIAPDGRIIVAGEVQNSQVPAGGGGGATVLTTQSVVARLLPIALTRITPGDYDGDGKADPAIFLTAGAVHGYRKSNGSGDVLQLFGVAGPGGSIPAPGDYDGDGITDLAAYLPSIGVLAYRPSSGGADVLAPFGTPGAGRSVPAPGDYDGDGKADLAVYLPSSGVLAYRPSAGGGDVLTPFGTPGTNGAIPAPGDYDGDGKTDLAVYLPAIGAFGVRPSHGGADVISPFGVAGAGRTIPIPGDYNGDGFTDLAAYLPTRGVYAYRPSDTVSPIDVVESFGVAGPGGSIPAPGDYDGDGKADLAAYFPARGLYGFRPSAGGGDVVQPFGIAGTAGQTIPASALAYASQGTASTMSPSGDTASTRAIVPLTDDLMPVAAKAKRKAAGIGG